MGVKSSTRAGKDLTVLNKRYSLLADVENGKFFNYVPAEDLSTGRTVFLSLVQKPLDEEVFKALQLGVANASMIKHPHLLHFTHVDGTPEQAILVSDSVRGNRLDFLLQDRIVGEKLLLQDRAKLLMEVVGALAEIHPLKVHGFPASEFIWYAGPKQWKMLGAGLAHLGLETLEKIFNLEKLYLPPEFKARQGRPSAASDVWMLGRMIDQMISGNTPVEEGGPGIDSRQSSERLLGQVIDTCEKNVLDERYSDAADVMVELRQWVRLLYPKPLRTVPPPPPSNDAIPEAPPPTEKKLFPKFVDLPTQQRKIIGDETAVWVYQKEGFDYGPFPARKIYELIRKDEISGDTTIRNNTTGQVQRLAEVTEFRIFLEDFEVDKAQMSSDELFEMRTGRKMTILRRVKRRLPVLAVLLAIIAAGLLGAWYWNQPNPRQTDMGSMFDFSLEPSSTLNTASINKTYPPPNLPDREFNKRKRVVRRRRPGDKGGPKDSNSWNDGEIVKTTMDFNKNTNGRMLSGSDISSVMRKVRPGISRCVLSGANASTGKVAVMFFIKLSGRLGGLSCVGSGCGRMAPCIKGVLNRVKIKPFVGGARKLGMVIRLKSQ